jgi:hypothetical protein
MKRVHIVQCLCPSRHCIIATAQEAEDSPEIKQEMEEALRRIVTDVLARGLLNPHCGLCGALVQTWTFEAAETVYLSLEAAMPALRASQESQMALAEEMRKTGRAYDSAKDN